MVSPLRCSDCGSFEFQQIVEGESWMLRCGHCGHDQRSGPAISKPWRDPPAPAPAAKAFEPYPAPADVSTVSLGAVVEVEDGRGARRRMQVIGGKQYGAAKREHPDGEFVTSESPIGIALAGRRVGEVVRVTVPAGPIAFTIVSVSYPADGMLPLGSHT